MFVQNRKFRLTLFLNELQQALLDENTKIMFFFQLVCTGLYQSFSRDWQVCTGNQFVNHFIVNQQKTMRRKPVKHPASQSVSQLESQSASQ